MQRMGQYPPPKGVTDIPGLELAGEVVAVGHGVKRFKVGDKVTALVAGGGYAEYCAVPEPQALPIPAGLSLIEAAAMPETFFTVYPNVFERGALKAGESLLVHGGSSGIGTVAVMLGKAFGARVFATAGSAEKCEACRKLGAEFAINYKSEDFVAITKKATNDKGVDVILDIVGGDYVSRNIEALATDGRLVQIGLLGSYKAQVNLIALMQRRATLTGSTLRARSIAEKGAIAAALRRHVWPLFESGAVTPVIHATFPLRSAAEAHRVMDSSEHIGKLVLVVS